MMKKLKGLWEVLVAGLLSVSFIACVSWKKTSEEFSGEAEIPRGVNAALKLDGRRPQKFPRGKTKIYF